MYPLTVLYNRQSVRSHRVEPTRMFHLHLSDPVLRRPMNFDGMQMTRKNRVMKDTLHLYQHRFSMPSYA